MLRFNRGGRFSTLTKAGSIHFFVVVAIFAVADVIYPSLVCKIPFDSFFQSRLPGGLRTPAKFGLGILRIDRIAPVVS